MEYIDAAADSFGWPREKMIERIRFFTTATRGTANDSFTIFFQACAFSTNSN